MKNRIKSETIQKHYPYKANRMWPDSPTNDVWWPESSNKEDSMVIGDGVLGDKESAELCAKCCNIAYRQAIKDVSNLFSSCGINVNEFVSQLTELEIPMKKVSKISKGGFHIEYKNGNVFVVPNR